MMRVAPTRHSGNGPRELNWASEIWDLRSVAASREACAESMLERHLRFRSSCGTPAAESLYAAAQSTLLPHLRLLNGSACELSKGFASCLSCRGSFLERCG